MGNVGIAHLRVVVRPGTWRGPASTLPSLHAFEFGGLIELDDTVDLAVRVLVILARVFLLAVHVHGGDAQVLGIFVGQCHLAASVFGSGIVV